jgi:hypothetical protein
MAKIVDRNSPLVGATVPSLGAYEPVGARLAREAFGVLEDAFAGKPRSYGGLRAELARRHATPAHKRMSKTRGFAETQRLGDPVNRQLILAEHQLGLLEA